MFFFFLSAFWSTLSHHITQGAGCQIHPIWFDASFAPVLLTFWTINRPWWTVILLCYADKLNPQLLAFIHKPQTKKIRKSLKIILPSFVNLALNYLKPMN